jgi:hypothetical protein
MRDSLPIVSVNVRRSFFATMPKLHRATIWNKLFLVASSKPAQRAVQKSRIMTKALALKKSRA